MALGAGHPLSLWRCCACTLESAGAGGTRRGALGSALTAVARGGVASEALRCPKSDICTLPAQLPPSPLPAERGSRASGRGRAPGRCRERVPLPASLDALRNLCVCELLPPRHVLRGRGNTQPVPAASCRAQEARAASALGLRAEGPADVCGVASRARACLARLVLPTPRGEAGPIWERRSTL